MKKVGIVVMILLIQISLNGQSTVRNWDLGGYMKNMSSVIILPKSDFVPKTTNYFDNLVHNRINFSWYPNDRLTLEADLRSRIFWGDQVKLRPSDYIELLDESNDYFTLSYGLTDSIDLAFHTMIDRLYFDYTIGNWQIRVGRQRINWGINTAWNPNDIFNAYSFTDFDYEEKPGSDAFLAKYYFDFASSIEIAVKAFDKKEEAVAAMLLKWNMFEYDIQVLAGIMEWNYALGGGWAGNLWSAGFKGEFTYFHALDEDEEDGFAMTLGLDYIFKNSLYANLGFLYNHNGNNDQSLISLFNFELSAKNLYPYKNAWFAALSYPFNPLLNGGVSIIYSAAETHPVFFSPNISYSLSNDLDIGFFGQLIMEKNEEWESPVQAFFVRLKYSY